MSCIGKELQERHLKCGALVLRDAAKLKILEKMTDNWGKNK